MKDPDNVAAASAAHREADFYRRVMHLLNDGKIPFLVGGTHMMEHYTGISRDSKDFDIHVRRSDVPRVFDLLSRAGYRTELSFPHWLGKVLEGQHFVDFIFSSGNGICEVDDIWFENGEAGEVLGTQVRFSPPEETIWSKAFIMERERYDGADVAHLLLACGRKLHWRRLLWRFGKHWRVLLSHLILFGFVYPSERVIPEWITKDLLARFEKEPDAAPVQLRICQGTLFSRTQYLDDIERRRYIDARISPEGTMNPNEIALWTAAADNARNSAQK